MEANQPYAKYGQLNIMKHNTAKHNVIKITISIKISEQQTGKARQMDYRKQSHWAVHIIREVLM